MHSEGAIRDQVSLLWSQLDSECLAKVLIDDPIDLPVGELIAKWDWLAYIQAWGSALRDNYDRHMGER